MKVEGLYQIKNNELISLSPRAFEKADSKTQYSGDLGGAIEGYCRLCDA